MNTKYTTTALAALLFSGLTMAKVPVLATDIEANSRIVNVGYSDLSLTQDLENGRNTAVVETDVTVRELGMIISGPTTQLVTPILSVDVSGVSSNSTSDYSNLDIYAGLAFEGLVQRHLLLFNYEDSSDEGVSSSLGMLGVYRAAPSLTSKGSYELVASFELQQGTSTAKGGHELSFGLNSKLPLSQKVNLISSLGLGFETDLEYSDGSSRKAKPGVNAELGLNIQPTSNLAIDLELGSYLQGYEYYREDGSQSFTEFRTGLGVMLDVSVAL